MIKKIYPIEFQTIKYEEQLEAKLQKNLEVLSNLFGNKSQLYQRKKLKIFDLEVLSLALTAENLSFSSECQFFR